MKPSESIGDIYTRFTDVINGFKALGKDFSNFELVTKILRSLPKCWDPKVTTIHEAKDLKTFPIKELIGSLMTYEMTCHAHDELENPLPKNRKDMALRTQEDHLKGTLNMILANKGHVRNRCGIRFVSGSHRTQTTFIKGPTLHVSSYLKCNFYCKSGYVVYKCPYRKLRPNKLVWVPKRSIRNSLNNDKFSRSVFEAPKSKWYLDSGCSKHMTGDPSQFSKLSSQDEGFITFGDNNQGKIIGKGTIDNKSTFSIDNVLLVDGLKYNLLSISQLCDNGYIVRFESNACIIEKPHNSTSIIAIKQNNIYTINLDDLSSETCFSALNDDAWLWHRRLGHASMKLISQITSKNLIRGIPKVNCKCFILNEKDALGKFDAKSDEGIFLGDSSMSKAFYIFNKRTLVIEVSIHVVFNEISEFKKKDFDDDFGLWYPKSDNFDLKAYADADFGRCRIDRKSTSGICQFLGYALVSWTSKK
ncbi:unnamed protein product [Musa textilis]